MTNEEVIELLALVELKGEIRSNNVQVSCPFAAVSGHKNIVDQHPSLGLYAKGDTVFWNCFTCGRKGNLRTFFQKLESELGVDCDAVFLRLDLLEKGDPEAIVSQIPAYDEHHRKDIRRDYPTFPESWLDPYKGRVPQYILDRGILLSVLKDFEVGFDKPAHRVVYPVRDRARALVGAVGGLTQKIPYQPKYKNYWHRIHSVCRLPLEHRDGKYKCPACGVYPLPESEVAEGFRKSNFLYAAWQNIPDMHETPIVVEGLVDCLKLWQFLLVDAPRDMMKRFCPVAIFGSKPSKVQANQIVALSRDRAVYIWMDNDIAGKEGSRELSEMIRKRCRIFRPQYPPDSFGADPGSLTSDQIYEGIRDAKVIL